MSLTWDYGPLAADYALRPGYAPAAVHTILEYSNLNAKSILCDIGAGTGRLTRILAGHGVPVVAIEPNPEMRAVGEAQCKGAGQIEWRQATGEATEGEDEQFDLVTYGSSFHTVDRKTALIEANRILKPNGWFACLWNHRDLNDPLQSIIEEFLSNTIPGFSHGVQREDQTQILQDTGFFSKVQRLSYPVSHTQTIDQALAHWRSHATVRRQAGNSFPQILAGIERILRRTKQEKIVVPYNTHVWLARKG